MKIFIRSIDLPFKVKGVTVQDQEGNYNVYINNFLGEDAKKRVCNHEINHIKLLHFQDFNPVVQNELEASC